MARVDANFEDGKRIIFTARERSWVNVRETLDDGPIGFSSGEILLMALGNCTLGTLTNHELLKDVPVRSLRATLESEGARNPGRTGSINVVIELDVDDDSFGGREDTLKRVADNCPVGNTLRFGPEVNVEVRLKARPAEEATESVSSLPS